MTSTHDWGSSWLDDLDDALRRDLLALGKRRTVDRGGELATAGARGRELVLVLSGTGRVVVRGRVVAHVGPGAFVGETFLDGRPHVATVVAESPVDALVLDAAAFRSLLRVPSATHELCRQLVARLRSAEPAIELRPVVPDDIDVVCSLVNRSARHDGIPQVWAVAELRELLDQDWVEPALDTRVALVDGEVVGWCYVLNLPAEVRLDRAFLGGVVDPDRRGKGIGTALLAWAVERAVERLAAHDHDLPRRIRASCYDWQAADVNLYERFGLVPTRWFDELARPLTGLPSVPVPDGIALRPLPEGDDDEVRRARNEAFADHWLSEPLDAASWHDLLHGYGGLPELSVIAVDRVTGDVVGVCVNQAYPDDDAVTGRREAWILNVGTVAAWRGRGVASAMVAWSLAAFAAAGFTHALLEVDSDSLTGAGRLYRALGFEPVRRSVVYELEV